MKKFIIAFLCLLGIGMSANAAISYVKTDITDLATGDIVVIADQTSKKAMSNDKGADAAPTATAITLSSDNSEITSTVSDNLLWKVSVSDGNYTFYKADDETKWLYSINQNNGVRVGTGDNKVFTWDSGYLKNTGTPRYVGVYSNQDWRCYTSTTVNIKDTKTVFYKQMDDTPAKPVVSIAVTPPTKTEYIVGETLDTTGCVVTATYDDASTADVTLALCEFTPETFDTAGTQTVTVTYLDKTATFDVTVNALPVLVSIAITTPPTKTTYEVGETLDTNGCVVTATYDNGDSEDVTADCMFSPSKLLRVGEQVVTVSYSEKETSFNVNVSMNPSLEEVIINPETDQHTIVPNAQIVAEQHYLTNPIILLASSEGGSNVPKYYDSGKDFRVYANGTLAISTNGNNMKKIVFILSTQGKKRLPETTPSTGSVSRYTPEDEDIWTVTWEGDASEVTFTVGEKAIYGSESTSGGQLCFRYIDIFDTESELLPAGLEFSVATATAGLGSPFTAPTLSKETDAAVTYTSSNESVATVDASTGEVTLVAAGTTTITARTSATATYKSGSASYDLIVYSAAYQTLADWIAAKPETASPIMSNATAVYQNDKNLYITDGSSWILIYGDLDTNYINGDEILAGYAGNYDDYYGLPEMVPEASTFKKGDSGTAVLPFDKEISGIGEANMNQYVKFTGVNITNVVGSEATMIDGNHETVMLYNKFSIENFNAWVGATVIGFVAKYNDKIRIYPTEIVGGERPTYTFYKVLDKAELAEGDKIIIVNEENKVALSSAKENYRDITDIEIEEDEISVIDGSAVQILTLEAGKTIVEEGQLAEDGFRFYTSDGYYLSANASSNYLKTVTTKDNKSLATTFDFDQDGSVDIIFAEGDARYLQYNNQNTRFSCYKNTQSKVQIYKQQKECCGLAEAKALAHGSRFYLDAELLVLKKHGERVYVYDTNDDSYALVILEGNELEAGSVITGKWKGTTRLIDGQKRLVPDAMLTESERREVVLDPVTIAYDNASSLTEELDARPIRLLDCGVVNSWTTSADATYPLYLVKTSASSEGDEETPNQIIRRAGGEQWVQITARNMFGLGGPSLDPDQMAKYDHIDAFANMGSNGIEVYPSALSSNTPIITGIETITADDKAGETYYVDMFGRRVAQPTTGFYLKVSGTQVAKVLVK